MKFLYEALPAMISSTIAYVLLYKVWNNPFRLIGNTVKKKLLSFVVIFILYALIVRFLYNYNISYKEVYNSLILGIWIMVNGRLFSTDFEGEDAYKKKA